MKRLGGVIVVAALAVAVMWSVSSGQADNFLSPPTGIIGPGQMPRPVATEVAAPQDGVAMTVAHVHDGDTLFLTAPDGTEQKVRLIGLDTPELRPAEECFAIAARDYLRQLVPDGSTVTVAADREARDQYDRYLYYVWTGDGVLVNLKLVADGYGTALRIEPNSAHWNELLAAETAARDEATGIWGRC